MFKLVRFVSTGPTGLGRTDDTACIDFQRVVSGHLFHNRRQAVSKALMAETIRAGELLTKAAGIV